MAMTDKVGQALGRPIAHETFKFALEVFQQAARGRMSGAHIPKPDPDHPGLYLTNVPINRGMLAVMNQTRHLDDAERQALGMRLMSFGETIAIAQGDDRFKNYFKPSPDNDGALMVSNAFTRAYAESRFKIDEKDMAVDWDDLHRLAEMYRAEEEGDAA